VSSEPKVSVVVPHYRDLKSLDACLEALGRQTYPRADFEIVVADNNSPESEAAVAQVIAGRARLTIVTEKGAGPARNGGVAAARAEILAFSDCDCVPEPDWLAEGLRALGDYDFVGGRMKVLVDDPARLAPAEAFERVFAFDNETYVRKKGFTVTANLFCRKVMFDKIGGFRVGVSEDVEWCHRAIAAGYRIGYAEKAVAGHPARRTWPELLHKWKRLNSETYLLYADRPGGRLKWLVRSLALPLSAVAHSPKVLASRELNSSGERLGALSMLYRQRLWRFVDAYRLALADAPRRRAGGR
jgi:GT2 family glycosyltransferase